jgi:hypothetical protein
MDIVSFNGKTYNSLEEMPADQRAAYEQVMAFMKDENNNGIPDMFEGDVIQKMLGLAANTRIVVNGMEVQSLEALPPEAREKYDKAMQVLGRMGMLPKGAQEMAGTSFQSAPQISTSEPAFARSPSIIQSAPSAISEDTGPRVGGILLAVVGVLFLCALIAVAGLLFLSQ